MRWEDLLKIFHVEPRGKKCTELFSHGFVLLSVLFLEHEPLETLQPMVRLLAAAVIEKDLLFVFKPFEVATCIIIFFVLPYGVFPFNRTGFDSFFFFLSFFCLFSLLICLKLLRI